MSEPVAVVGAGHHGLVAAVRLAARGCEVVVLEAAPHAGGGVRTEELTLPGFRHDTCSGFFPLAAASPAFRALELELDWVNPPVAMTHLLDARGGEVALHQEVGLTARSLEACAPGAGRAWEELVRTLWPQRHALIATILGRLPPVGAGARLVAGMRSKLLEVAPLVAASSATIGLSLFGDSRAAAWLASSGAHADLSPRAGGSGAFALGLNFLGHVVGWPYPRGGAGAITEALLSRLAAAGAQIRCGSAVAAIEVSRGRVSGVRLAGGERVPAGRVICTASPKPLVGLLPSGVLPGRVQRRLERWRYGLGTLKLDWALSGAVPWVAERAREAAVVQLGGDLEEIDESLAQASAGRFPDRPALVVGQQSLHDRTRAPHGQHTLYAYVRVPQHTGLADDDLAQRIEQRIEHYAPGFRDLVLARRVRTPERIAAENPSMQGGDLASGSCELDQQLIFRPDPRLCRGRTPVRGLYVAGAWVHPGPGVHGVSGAAAADAVLRDLRWRFSPRRT
jgi:phytoene dehydrogenase-like protein